jgi:hypothetical protein
MTSGKKCRYLKGVSESMSCDACEGGLDDQTRMSGFLQYNRIQSACKRVRRFKGDENPDRLYQYSLPDDPFDVAILACIERRYAKFRDVSKKSAENVAQIGIELDPPSASLLKKEAVSGSKSLPIVGEVFQCGDTEYRVKGIREREGVSWFVMQYLGYEYLPVWVRCDRFAEWMRGDCGRRLIKAGTVYKSVNPI